MKQREAEEIPLECDNMEEMKSENKDKRQNKRMEMRTNIHRLNTGESEKQNTQSKKNIPKSKRNKKPISIWKFNVILSLKVS
jgi:hypothetical protein